MRFLKTFLILLFFLSILSSANGQNSQNRIDLSKPEAIDPLNEHTGDFLDVDLGFYEWKAREAYKRKDYMDAARHYLFILRFDQDNENLIYYLACCYGLMGKPKLAAKYLEKAVNAGFTNIDHMLKDKDFDRVRKDKEFVRMENTLVMWRKTLGEVLYIKATKYLKCRVHLPENYDSRKSYPLIIGLHGNGGNSEDLVSLWKIFKKPDFIYAAGEGAYQKHSVPGSKVDMFSWSLQTRERKLWKKIDSATEEYIVEIAEELSRKYNTDEIYLFGFSEGAAYTFITGIKHPDIFKGIICFGGYMPEIGKSYSLLSKNDIKKGKGLKVFIAHGRSDNAVNYDKAAESGKMLEENGYNVTFQSFDGGHVVPADILQKAIKMMTKNYNIN